MNTVARFALLAVICTSTTLPAQNPSQVRGTSNAAQVLTVQGLDGKVRSVTAKELAGLRRVDTTVTAHQVTGRYGGVLLTDVLALAGAPHGDSLRGKALSIFVLVEASDGYRAVFGLAEFDAGYTDRIAILADRKNGELLPATEAPYHLVIPGDKRPARWVRQVVRISLHQAQ